MPESLLEKASPQFIRECLSRATPEDRLSGLLEVYDLLEDDERIVFIRALASRLVDEVGNQPLRSAAVARANFEAH